MRWKHVATTGFVCLGGLQLSACTATYSFAPPSVNLARESSADERNCKIPATATTTAITKDVDGAILLTENFVVAYRCAARQLADGRQDFEIPATLSLIGGTTAAALGAAPVVAIATGTTSALYNAGKSYYDPDTKLTLVRAAQTGAVCVFSVATGGTSYRIEKNAIDAAQLIAGDKAPKLLDADLIGVAQRKVANDNRRFFGEVYGALLSIDAILAERMASAGKLDLEAIKKALEAIGDTPEQDPGQNNLIGRTLDEVIDDEVDFDALHKALQECVLKARV